MYSKRSDLKSVDELTEAADAFIAKRFGKKVVCSTPNRAAAEKALRSAVGLTEPTRKRKLF